MKKALTMVWHIVVYSVAAYFLYIVVSKVSANLAGTDRNDALWPVVLTGSISMAAAGVAIFAAAAGASWFFARSVGATRRVIASLLISAVFAGWIYSAFLWVNYPLRTWPTTLVGEMMNFDGALIAFISIVLLIVPAATGTGLFGHLSKLAARKTRAQQDSDGQA
ncbi:MAG: hypothetical protein P1U86_21740 [Verrucomicrobiales bacterium]|nr:hypothetical protein [Verrucomicrobiales bacterium]